jgi:hypothetical protein
MDQKKKIKILLIKKTNLHKIWLIYNYDWQIKKKKTFIGYCRNIQRYIL